MITAPSFGGEETDWGVASTFAVGNKSRLRLAVSSGAGKNFNVAENFGYSGVARKKRSSIVVLEYAWIC